MTDSVRADDLASDRRHLERRGDGMGDSGDIRFTIKELFMDIKDDVGRLTTQMSNLQLHGSNKAQEASKDVGRLEERVRLLETTAASQTAITRLGIAVAVAILASAGTWITILLRLK